MIPRDAAGNLTPPPNVIRDAHRRGLDRPRLDVPRREPVPARRTSAAAPIPTAPGDLAGEITAFVDAGMDGFFTDNPDIGSATAANLP